VGGGGEAVGVVAEGELDLSKELFVGQVSESLGHAEGGLFQQRAQPLADGLDPGLVCSGVVKGVIRGVR
jgi:hypothetical protein